MKVSVRPTLVAQSLKALLVGRLCRAEARLVELVGVSNFLAVKTVASRERAAGRLIVDYESVATLEELCSDVGVAFRRAPFGFSEKADLIPGTHHQGSFISLPAPGSRAVVYFGVTAACAEGAEIAEILGNHALLGELLGYPPCCTKFFVTQDRGGSDLLPLSISDIGPYPREMNPLLHFVLGYPQLLFHFPCSPRCGRSRELRAERSLLLERAIGSAWESPDLGRGIAIYGPESGVALITRHRRLGESVWAIDEVVTMRDQTASLLADDDSATLRIDSVNRFAIGRHAFTAPHQFVALFE